MSVRVVGLGWPDMGAATNPEIDAVSSTGSRAEPLTIPDALSAISPPG